MAYLVALVLAIGFGVPIAVIGGALGQGRAAARHSRVSQGSRRHPGKSRRL